jgi:ubiquinone/menaquinone biosynthesis C-methylase UbiE
MVFLCIPVNAGHYLLFVTGSRLTLPTGTLLTHFSGWRTRLAEQSARFDNGAAYEQYMGIWSQRVGEKFVDWLQPKLDWRWLDVGCGNGAFTETIVARCAPAAVTGIDPSEGQLNFARTRSALKKVEFRQADAMALPYPDNVFDVAVMPLVIFFVPDPVKGIDEMKRVVHVGGIVAAYSWDMVDGGFPYTILHDELRAMGIPPAVAPSVDASRPEVMLDLWTAAKFRDIETRELTVQRTFANFEEYWNVIQGGPSVSAKFAAMSEENRSKLKTRLQMLLKAGADGSITYDARANAIKGYV